MFEKIISIMDLNNTKKFKINSEEWQYMAAIMEIFFEYSDIYIETNKKDKGRFYKNEKIENISINEIIEKAGDLKRTLLQREFSRKNNMIKDYKFFMLREKIKKDFNGAIRMQIYNTIVDEIKVLNLDLED